MSIYVPYSDQLKILKLVMKRKDGISWNDAGTIWGKSGLRFSHVIDCKLFRKMKAEAKPQSLSETGEG